MKLSYSWLSEYLNEKVSPERMSEILTSVGLEVEHIEKKEAIKGNLEGLVIGKVLTCTKHPNADKLNITTVDIGAEEAAQIVCGAPNVGAGQTVVVAQVGATLYPKDGDGFKIKKAKIRGEESFGMICAEDEIGLGEGHDGIIVIQEDVKSGTPAAEYYKLPAAEVVYDIGLTPNRMDAMSHLGALKDVSAFLANEKNEMVEVAIPKNELPKKTADLPFEIEVQDQDKCPRYQGISIANVRIAPSPDWLQNKLKSIDIQPINNVVDITNFVLHECGQPLHAFDYDKITQHKVIIRKATEKEAFTALDEKEYTLSTNDLVIANPQSAMCIAGVFGGIDSGVSNNTKNIFLESAFFESIGIRKTAVQYNLRTEAAMRYEKGVDISNLQFALERAAQLICEIAGGEIASDIVDHYAAPKEKNSLTVSYKKMNALAGKEYTVEQVNRILESLQFELNNKTENNVTLAIPYAKTDIEFEADIVEEIMRIDGIDNIPFTGSIAYKIGKQSNNASQQLRRKLINDLVGLGFYEIITNSITHSAFYEEDETIVKLKNNLSTELDVMRPSMVETALQSIAHNLNRKNTDLKFFEFGKVYSQRKGHYIEQEKCCLYLCGQSSASNWNQKTQAVDVFYCKGIVQSLFPMVAFNVDDDILWGKKNIGRIERIEAKKKKQFDINTDVWVVTFDWKSLVNVDAKRKVKFSEIPKFPGSTRDLALVVSKATQYIELENAIQKIVSDKMISLDVFDVFESEKLGSDKKSYAVRLHFLDTEKTITDKEVDADMQKVIKALEGVGAEVRG